MNCPFCSIAVIELFASVVMVVSFLALCSIRKSDDPALGIDQSNKLCDVFDPDIEWSRVISPELAIAVAVLEEQHVRRAAERLGVPQPTVSAVMHRLADAIGAPLVAQRGRGIAATDAGRAFPPPAHKRIGKLRVPGP